MRKLMLSLGAVSALALSARSAARTRCTRPRRTITRIAPIARPTHGNYYKAAREEHKPQREERKADDAPLP